MDAGQCHDHGWVAPSAAVVLQGDRGLVSFGPCGPEKTSKGSLRLLPAFTCPWVPCAGPHVTLAFSQAHFRRARPLPSGMAPTAPPGLEAGLLLHLLADVLGLMTGSGTHHRVPHSSSGQLPGPVLGSLNLKGSALQESRGNSRVTVLNLRSHLEVPGWGGRSQSRLAFEEQRAEVSR